MFIRALSVFLLFPLFANAASLAAPSVRAPQPHVRTFTPLAVTSDDFESYTPGTLAGQGTWWNPNNSGEDFVIDGGITGRSGRVFANSTVGFTYSAGRTFDAAFGILSLDVRAPALDSPFLFGPFSDTNSQTGLLDPEGTIAVGPDRMITLFQRHTPDTGQYISTGSYLSENTVARLSWDVRSDGTLALYRDGRLLVLGRAETVVSTGAPRLLGAVLVGSSNGVTRSSDGSRNTLTFDNISGTLPAQVDPAGQADLVLIATFGNATLGGTLAGEAEVAPNGNADFTLFVLNTSANAASGATISGSMPVGYTLSGADCGISQVGTAWTTATFSLSANQTRTCHAKLHLASSVSSTEGWTIPLQVGATTADPYADNNQKSVIVRAGLFASGFE